MIFSSWVSIKRVMALFAVLGFVVVQFTVFSSSFVPDTLAKPVLFLGDGGDGKGFAGETYFKNVKGDGEGSDSVIRTVDNILSVLRNLLGPVLVVYFVYIGVRLMIAQGEEEEISKYGKQVLYILIGAAFIILAENLSDILFITNQAGDSSFLSDGEVRGAGERVSVILKSIIMFLRYLLGGVALFYTVKSGALIVFAAGEEESVTKQKEVFMWGFVGFIVIMISDALVTFVLFPESKGVAGAALPDVASGIGLIVRLTNLLLSVIGGIAVISLVAGGVMYTMSFGSEDRKGQATKIIYGSLLGLIIAFSSYTIVAEFVPNQREISVVQPPSIEKVGTGLGSSGNLSVPPSAIDSASGLDPAPAVVPAPSS
jgi:hypothetical protein